jgi:alkanesulfonate monooxygenase SsuD/methylene tetrahydromethanopterin reductase-like flavin-dependent oxidoreductase (luciferase family)
MKFGIFFELSAPRPIRRGVEQRVYHEALEQARLADELGFDQVWAVEHHFLEGLSSCSAPEIFLTAVAMQTKQIRVGHGIAVCVPSFISPIKLAERTAALDIVSNGRVDLGTGRSSTWTELGGFRADLDETKKTWDEYVRVIPKMWTQDYFGYEGRAFSMPQRAVLPKPVQDPHPPLWLAVTSPGTEMEAAERGMGYLSLSFSGSLADHEARAGEYRRVIQHCEPVGSFVNEQVTFTNFMHCAEDNAEAVAAGSLFNEAFGMAASQFLDVKESIPTNSYQRIGLLRGMEHDKFSSGRQEIEGLAPGLAFGDPDALIKKLRGWESIGADRVVFVLNCMDVIPQQKVLDSLRLFAREVMPKFDDTSRSVAAAGEE